MFIVSCYFHSFYSNNKYLSLIQVGILVKELCRLHQVPEPPDLDGLTLGMIPGPEHPASPPEHGNGEPMDSELEDGLDSEPDSDMEEDLHLEMDETVRSNKVQFLRKLYCFL